MTALITNQKILTELVFLCFGESLLLQAEALNSFKMNQEVASPGKIKSELPVQLKTGKQVNENLKRYLLFCGILSTVLYTAMNVFIPMFDPGYSSFSQTVSELSAIDAPTRSLWLPFGLMYSILISFFGLGVWMTDESRRGVHIAGILITAYGIISLFWPPMHQREVLAAGGGTTTDIMHIVFTAVCIPLMMVAMGFIALSFGKQFRLYTIVTIVIMLIFGGLTGLASPLMEADLPTPWMGVWERISIAAMMLWIAILAIKLLREEKT
jgi:hypothetical protein